jgi:AcrR family transcriptional regulator
VKQKDPRNHEGGILEVSMEIQDRRVKRTQHLLARALIVLTLEKGYEAVTIRDITERADVGYATFFRHYHDKDELLKDVLDVVLTEIIDLLGSTQPAADPTTIGVLLFRYVQQQSEVVRVLLMSHALLQRSIEIATQKVVSEHTFLPDSVVPLEIAAHHIVASSISLIQWWLDHQMPYPPERMGVIYHELIIRPTSELAFSS